MKEDYSQFLKAKGLIKEMRKLNKKVQSRLLHHFLFL
jgi:hypothetical protein